MAKRRSYETILLENLKKLNVGQWYKIADRKDYDKFVATLKCFIDLGEPLTFSDDYQRLRREDYESNYLSVPVWHKMETLPPGYRIEKVVRGTQETCHVISKKVPVTVIAAHEGTSYRIFDGDKLIAIEN